MEEQTDNSALRVLVVEDSLLVAEHVGEILESTHLRLETRMAQSDVDALSLVEKFEPEIVLLDLMLKKGDGFAVMRELQKKNDKPLVIVMTNYALPNYRYYAKLTGADHFLDKSADLQEIRFIVEKFASARNARAAEKPSLKLHGIYSIRM